MPLVCCCSLAGTVACKNCLEYIKYFGEPTWTWPQTKPIPIPGGEIQPQILPKPKKVIVEFEYDKEGRVIKKTITESET